MLNLISISAIFRKVGETSQYHYSVPALRKYTIMLYLIEKITILLI